MSSRSRILLPVLLCVGVLVAGLALAGGLGRGTNPGGPGEPGSSGANGPGDGSGGAIAPTPTPRPPVGGTELYGYLPYWEMTDTTAAYLDGVPLTTLAVFSVSARRTGELNTSARGYERITSEIGRRIIDDAQERGARVELVFTSFGPERNGTFFGRVPRRGAAAPTGVASPAAPPTAVAPTGQASGGQQPPPPYARTVPELVALADELGVDGINVDVEQLDELDRVAYGDFLTSLRRELVRRMPRAEVSVATEAGLRGVGNAAAAAAAGVDRVFLMGYDYHWGGSNPGAVSPVERTDGLYDLRWSIDRYVEAGVPRDRILLGLPLYGTRWRTLGPDRTWPVVGSGQAWIPRQHLDRLADPTFIPSRDSLELSEFFVEPDGKEFLLTYYDSPATLRPKLALARDQGLAGAGFWAIGYERDVPGYRKLMDDFRAGNVDRSEAPTP
jgi:hypothetical protein